MTIEELQERFNELRAKKWRTVCTKTPAEVTGFYKYAGGDYIVVTSDDDLWSVQPDTLFRYSLGERTPYIEEVPPPLPSYADWPIDAKILVWDEGKTKGKRHFAGITPEGHPKAWNDGYTSWTTNTWSSWDYAELAEN